MSKRRKPDMNFLLSVAHNAYCDEAHNLQDRELAYMRKAKELGANYEQANKMLDRQRNGWPITRKGKKVIQRTIHPRKLVGAYPTSSAVVSDGAGGSKLLHKTGPTCKVREYKGRRSIRNETACRQHTHIVDQRRFYAHITAPYRKGGGASVKVRKANRGRLHKADQLARKGELAAAIAVFRGEL